MKQYNTGAWTGKAGWDNFLKRKNGMKKYIFIFTIICIFGCKEDTQETTEEEIVAVEPVLEQPKVKLTVEQANDLVDLPLRCLSQEYPNKLGQTLAGSEEMGEPHELHPAFYGCFDWHSSVHAHWSLVSLLKQFPDLKKSDAIREQLSKSLSEENIKTEVAYFNRQTSNTYERTYGWSWLLKLSQELHKWDDTLAPKLEQNLQPLTDLILKKYSEFLPKLKYPVRTGEHDNTAFALVFAYDFAVATKNEEFQNLIRNRATSYYLKDKNCPYQYEPSGYDFLSPCFEEIDIMRRVLPESAFEMWINDFFPQLKDKDFNLEIAEVSDQSDGKLVHLEGLNFSRAWTMAGLANQYPEKYGHLKVPANQHLSAALPHITKGNYEGEHWLGSFAIYAIKQLE